MKTVPKTNFINKPILITSTYMSLIASVLVDHENILLRLCVAFIMLTQMLGVVVPYGREVVILPLRRDQAYASYLKTQKNAVLYSVCLYLLVQVIKNFFGGIEVSYWDLVFSAEIVFVTLMLSLYFIDWYAKMTTRRKGLEVVLKLLLMILYFVVFLLAWSIAGDFVRGTLKIPTSITIIGIPICIVMYAFVDKYRYRINIGAVLDYDYAPGILPDARGYSAYSYNKHKVGDKLD